MCYLHEAFFIQMLIKNWYLLMPQLKEKISSQWKEIWSPPLMPPPYLGDPPKISPLHHKSKKKYISHCNTDVWVCDMNMNSNFLYLLKKQKQIWCDFQVSIALLYYYLITILWSYNFLDRSTICFICSDFYFAQKIFEINIY